MAHDSNGHSNGHDDHGHGIRPYIIVALILGVITYVEFAIIEYEVPFLGDGATLFWLILLSVVKFIMVIMYFMHLKGDDAAYSGFFGSGIVIAMGTFVAFTFLMTAPGSLSFVRSQLAPDGRFVHGEAGGAHGDDHGRDDAVASSIESDGYSRELSAVLGDGRPKDLSYRVDPPAAPEGGWELASVSPLGRADAAASEDADASAEAADEEAATAEDADAEDAGAEGSEADDAVADDSAADDGEADSGAQASEAEAETSDDAGAEGPAQATDDDWDEELGAEVYSANCASCHQASGQGIPGAFPPLAGHAAELASSDGGRSYLVATLLYGLQGQIRVSGQSYNGVMPAWAHLDDEEIAAVINHVLYTWDDEALPGDFTPVRADEVAAERDQGLSGQDVSGLRDELDLP